MRYGKKADNVGDVLFLPRPYGWSESPPMRCRGDSRIARGNGYEDVPSVPKRERQRLPSPRGGRWRGTRRMRMPCKEKRRGNNRVKSIFHHIKTPQPLRPPTEHPHPSCKQDTFSPLEKATVYGAFMEQTVHLRSFRPRQRIRRYRGDAVYCNPLLLTFPPPRAMMRA